PDVFLARDLLADADGCLLTGLRTDAKGSSRVVRNQPAFLCLVQYRLEAGQNLAGHGPRVSRQQLPLERDAAWGGHSRALDIAESAAPAVRELLRHRCRLDVQPVMALIHGDGAGFEFVASRSLQPQRSGLADSSRGAVWLMDTFP